ncbi:alpha/beta fold hydrolase [Novosphingobium sp. KCTC 2891]|uniref:alpha/beta fold hydrolase n=1 Tax=Novosphingobium sp. KCTC 2891 TaxID=2989730 RepID=UPI0022220A54|nr:alpha/beta fold hydrolase [Novosphingobium sp. KCTC 2891]MCW1382742.1 alpha/beta fold hydrolase [Novosphingobium sp. KCTC 2891]
MSEGTGQLSPEAVGERVRREVDRALKRNIKGLEFLAAGRQEVGAMAKDLVHREGTAMLYRYRPVVDEIYRLPLLIVSPPSNKGYIFDLAPGQSMVEFLLQRGYDVFNLDWAPPRHDESHLGLTDYVDRFIPDSMARIEEITGEREVTLAGYCMGGTLATIHTALHTGPGEANRVKNLMLFATPIDFSTMRLFQTWADKRHFDVDMVVDRLGVIPPELMLGAFDLSRPANRTAGRLHLWSNMWNDEFVRSYRMFDRWAAETLPVPGEYFREQIKKLMWANALVEGTLDVGGRIADLSRVKVPILNIIAQHDHVVSREAASPLMTLTGSEDREEILSKGGHVSLVAGPAALRRLWPLIDDWLGKRSV